MNKDIFQKSLSSKQAELKLAQSGVNEIREIRQFTLLFSFLSQFNNFLSMLLIFAGLISFFFGEVTDSAFIFIIVLMNAIFGAYQELKAEISLQSLKKFTTARIRVIRDSAEIEIDSRQLVPGDTIYIEEGTKIPADIRILKSWYLEINEASLTGEALPIAKNEHERHNNQAYMGTLVTRGRAYAQVEKTGMQTKFGQIAKKLSTIKSIPTPLQKKLTIFGKQIGILGLVSALLVFLLSFIENKNLFESFLFAVSLAVAAVPEGLPAVLTVTLSIGVERMAKKGSIIRQLAAIETLGSITILATDKTGTLTLNDMNVEMVWVNNHIFEANKIEKSISETMSLLFINGIVCSTTSLVFKVKKGFDIVGDATEGAILLLAEKMGLNSNNIKSQWKIIDEKSFDTKLKRMMVIVQKNQQKYLFSKGSPESILKLCTKVFDGKAEKKLTEQYKEVIEQKIDHFAKQGLRMIAFSYKTKEVEKMEEDHVFIGFIGLSDPVRPEAKEAVKRAQSAGIKVIMITGDNELTAAKIATETGIIKKNEDILIGQQLDNFTDEELVKILPQVKVFARTSPFHKYRLVKLLQKTGEIVAVTGDGVNDALALRQAHIGVAMGITGTDVAKEAADMIITDDNFATLVTAIEEGRTIFNHIKNSIRYLLTTNAAEVFSVFLTVLSGLPPILTAIQILYINLATDGLPALSFAFAPKNDTEMNRPPRKTTSFLTNSDFKYILVIGFFGSLLTVFSYLVGSKSGNIKVAQTMAFTTLIFIQPFILADLWISHRFIISRLHILLNPIFIMSFLIPFLLHPIIIYNRSLQPIFHTVPLSLPFLVLAFLYSFGITLVVEGRKIVTSLSRH